MIWRHAGFPLPELFGSGVGAVCATSLSRSRLGTLSSSSEGAPSGREDPRAVSEIWTIPGTAFSGPLATKNENAIISRLFWKREYGLCLS
ncbi:MAG: hypothetical protein LKJ88_00215 [Bacilli bacterium]|nr:hypothetical protein [Bacilli bacterium]